MPSTISSLPSPVRSRKYGRSTGQEAGSVPHALIFFTVSAGRSAVPLDLLGRAASPARTTATGSSRCTSPSGTSMPGMRAVSPSP
ncbi:hypothetical protein ACFQ2K_21755 [Streptomyces sanglieri]|uniref:Uncharacterized protein n=1 Tax=Streptomyces sanglieri TaxID=193460 RepID=A0ABW2WU76_9ACTN